MFLDEHDNCEEEGDLEQSTTVSWVFPNSSVGGRILSYTEMAASRRVNKKSNFVWRCRESSPKSASSISRVVGPLVSVHPNKSLLGKNTEVNSVLVLTFE